MSVVRARLAWSVLAFVATPCALAEGMDALLDVDPYALAAPPNRPPTRAHPFGTDALGRDILSRVLHGGRVSLLVASLGAAAAFMIGAAVGLTAGYRGGVTEQVLMRFTEAVMALPKLPLMLLLASATPGQALGLRPGAVSAVLGLVVVIGLFSWMDVARLARAATRQVRHRDFVRAAEGLGLGPLRVLRLHVLPHLAGPLGVAFALDLGENVLYESALSFLGLGISPPTPSWGALLARGLPRMSEGPLLMVVPGLATLAVVASVHILAEDLRERTDPATARL